MNLSDNLSPWDFAVLIAYLFGMVVMGLWFARKNTSTEEYFLGGRRFSGWVVGLSLVGTSISSITFLAYPGDAFKTAWLRYLPNLMLPIAVAIAAIYFLPLLRRDNATTAYQFLQKRFGSSVRIYGALAFVIAQLVRISIILYLLGLMIQEISGLDPISAIVIGGILVALYTVLGGIDAVIWTDVIQTIVLALGGIFCLWVIIDLVPGGLGEIISIAEASQKLSFAQWNNGQPEALSWSFSLQEKTGIMMLLVGLTAWLTEYSSNQNTVQRFVASKSMFEARKAMLICVAVSLPIWAFYMFLGTSLFAFFETFPAPEATAMLSGELKAEQILPFFMVNYLPTGLLGLVIAAALAAAMSSLDSSINAISTVTVVDLHKPFRGKQQTDQQHLKLARLIACGAAVFMVVGAIFLQQAETKTLQDTAVILGSLLSGGLLGLYLIGFFVKPGAADERGIWVGIVASLLFTVWTVFSKQGWLPEAMSFPFDLYYTGLVGNILMFVVAYLAVRFWAPSQAPQNA